MSERNPLPPCLAHLAQLAPKPVSSTALHYLINDLRQYAKALDSESQSIIAEDAAETMTRAADHLEATRKDVAYYVATHTALFRPGEPALIMGVVIRAGSPCFRVRYPDGVEDDTPIENEDWTGKGGLGRFYQIRREP